MENFGGSSPPGSSKSGSSVTSSNDFNQRQPKSEADLMMESACLDFNMRDLKLKVQGKLEEMKHLSVEKSSSVSALENMKKQLKLLQDRESSLLKAITRIRDNNIVSEGLESAVIQNLKALEISNEEQKSKWETMIKAHSATISSHQEIYSSLPWVKEKKMQAVKVEAKRILLERLKLREQENESKQSMFETITRERMKIEIVKLSQLVVGRNNERRKSEELDSLKKRLQEEIEVIERETKEIEDEIFTRTQEMMRRIVDRSSVKENLSHPETSKESKRILVASSLRGRLSFNKISSPRSSENASPPCQAELDAPVGSPDQPENSPVASPLPEVQADPTGFDAAAEPRRDETSQLLCAPSETIQEVTSSLGRPISLKSLLKPPSSLAQKPVTPSPVPPPYQPSTDDSSPDVAFTNQAQNICEAPSNTASGKVSHNSQPPFKRPVETPHLPENDDLPKPKKTKVMPPKSAVTKRPSKPKEAPASSLPPKAVKRVTFMAGSQIQQGGSPQNEDGSPGIAVSLETAASDALPSTSQPSALPEKATQPEPPSVALTSSNNDVSGPSKPQSIPVSGTDAPSPPSSDFPQRFSSPPQPYTEQNALQGSTGNFESIFGAIFNSPQTPNEPVGFQFPIAGV